MKDAGIIFDCDGTLVDSLGSALESFNYALRSVGEGTRSPEEIKRYFGQAADRIFLNLLGDREKALSAFERYIDHQSSLAETMNLHAGIRELLNELEERQIPMGVVTGRHERDLEVVLKPHRLADAFLVLVADSQLPKSKPAPNGILRAAEEMSLPTSRTIYVGDSSVDIQAARAAGSIAVAAVWDSLAREEELSRYEPDFIAHHPIEVLRFFERRFGP